MEIKDSATYPYPIWGLNDDYLGPEPDGIPTMSRDSVTNEFVFNYKLTTDNAGIARLIKEDKEKYPIYVFIHKDKVTLTIDTTGVALHKRGYREKDRERCRL